MRGLRVLGAALQPQSGLDRRRHFRRAVKVLAPLRFQFQAPVPAPGQAQCRKWQIRMRMHTMLRWLLAVSSPEPRFVRQKKITVSARIDPKPVNSPGDKLQQADTVGQPSAGGFINLYLTKRCGAVASYFYVALRKISYFTPTLGAQIYKSLK